MRGGQHRIAVLSDLHGQLVALQAVLDDLAAAGAEEIVVAGDMVNFGPCSREVVDALRERGAKMVRGNHESELVAPYGTAAMPLALASSLRYAGARWTCESLGPERRSFLASLPDRLLLDEATLVVHGSPRHVRDGVSAERTEAELEAMVAGEPARLVFSGHIHRPVIRELSASPERPLRRLVNVGSVGFPLDGNPHASYALIERSPSGAPGEWRVEHRRVAYDVEAAIAAYDNGLRDAWPTREFVDLFTRSMRTGHDYFARWLRENQDIPDDQIALSVRQFLRVNP
ncbi:MAG TPA: metallophosphoesterase family protein [Chloroflexota bacterium]|nr:metallophosphoesterase family protein [Chloroflexota bacterium]